MAPHCEAMDSPRLGMPGFKLDHGFRSSSASRRADLPLDLTKNQASHAPTTPRRGVCFLTNNHEGSHMSNRIPDSFFKGSSPDSEEHVPEMHLSEKCPEHLPEDSIAVNSSWMLENKDILENMSSKAKDITCELMKRMIDLQMQAGLPEMTILGKEISEAAGDSEKTINLLVDYLGFDRAALEGIDEKSIGALAGLLRYACLGYTAAFATSLERAATIIGKIGPKGVKRIKNERDDIVRRRSEQN